MGFIKRKFHFDIPELNFDRSHRVGNVMPTPVERLGHLQPGGRRDTPSGQGNRQSFARISVVLYSTPAMARHSRPCDSPTPL